MELTSKHSAQINPFPLPQVWLDRDKSILYQVGRDHDLSFKFKVKFYSPDPNLLEDEFTR